MPNGNGSKSKKRKAAAEGKPQKKKKKKAGASHDDAAVRDAVADAAASHVASHVASHDASHDASRTTSAAEVRRACYDPNAETEAWRAVLKTLAAGLRLLEKVDVYRFELPEDVASLEDLVFNKLRRKKPPQLSCTKVTEDSDSRVIELLGRSFVAAGAGNPVAALFAADFAELRQNGAPEDSPVNAMFTKGGTYSYSSKTYNDRTDEEKKGTVNVPLSVTWRATDPDDPLSTVGPLPCDYWTHGVLAYMDKYNLYGDVGALKAHRDKWIAHLDALCRRIHHFGEEGGCVLWQDDATKQVFALFPSRDTALYMSAFGGACVHSARNMALDTDGTHIVPGAAPVCPDASRITTYYVHNRVLWKKFAGDLEEWAVANEAHIALKHARCPRARASASSSASASAGSDEPGVRLTMDFFDASVISTEAGILPKPACRYRSRNLITETNVCN